MSIGRTSNGSVLLAKRLMREKRDITENAPEGVVFSDSSDSLMRWNVDIVGASGTLYENERYTLRFKFSAAYPFEAPEVVFVGEEVPVHPHVYSNGHICLSILGDQWSPVLSVSSVCVSILSMLSSCKEKKKPPDDSAYMRYAPSTPRNTTWHFHDDDV
ncbi:unnamed protein product [Notodromas monacha]|uniref:N-terminal E2 ubiquitin-conjugating enzyme n=1 Tax=Notodromas monacha TaxID=399045 RepID=A0A7R9BNS2_9CRUS|nr:unnamed protein product [Notodromas monacha]CAG0918045.1 unnamed protein product [Notodromas monacha]